MAIPEQVKRQAMDAVNHRETTAMIRRMSARYGDSFSAANSNMAPEQKSYAPLSDEVKRQAMDAVSHPEVRAHVRLLEETGSVRPAHTPSFRAQAEGRRIHEMYRAGRDADSVHQTVTKNNFGRDYV